MPTSRLTARAPLLRLAGETGAIGASGRAVVVNLLGVEAMKRGPIALAVAVVLTLVFAIQMGLLPEQAAAYPDEKGEASAPMLGHMVFFTLKESSPENRDKLVGACDKYLSDHDGTVYYSAGAIAEEFDRPVNVTDFDVALHVVFKDKAAHDVYQTHPEHLKFIEENKDTWKQVRVFDSNINAKK
jgi:hypothetical protein